MVRRAKLDGLALLFDGKDDGGIVESAAVVKNDHPVGLGSEPRQLLVRAVIAFDGLAVFHVMPAFGDPDFDALR